ncbi:hypothetical protein DY000_02024311 [Brassica cretica]|uniref:Uncharacterized protein n=1 Tax=Brassica cretica TaxID=69181 RepID=A0ABQ7EI19_BRACR|nr:hypothetical protein DY000_02024311 [Brassica cretica]
MKISKEHAESIEDSNSLHILWGRFAYDMLMSSIKERNEISLSQKTIAVRTMQLLGHCDDDPEDVNEKASKKHTLSLVHARNVNK